jgi:hypothetical protein
LLGFGPTILGMIRGNPHAISEERRQITLYSPNLNVWSRAGEPRLVPEWKCKLDSAKRRPCQSFRELWALQVTTLVFSIEARWPHTLFPAPFACGGFLNDASVHPTRHAATSALSNLHSTDTTSHLESLDMWREWESQLVSRPRRWLNLSRTDVPGLLLRHCIVAHTAREAPGAEVVLAWFRTVLSPHKELETGDSDATAPRQATLVHSTSRVLTLTPGIP